MDLKFIRETLLFNLKEDLLRLTMFYNEDQLLGNKILYLLITINLYIFFLFGKTLLISIINFFFLIFQIILIQIFIFLSLCFIWFLKKKTDNVPIFHE